MTRQNEKVNTHLLQLVLSLQAGAMHNMGKIASPLTGKIERNLDAARHTIDTIEMLNTKMAGNLTPEEARIIQHVLYELRLNYVDEVKRDEAKKAEKKPGDKDTQPSSAETETKKADPGPNSSDADASETGEWQG